MVPNDQCEGEHLNAPSGGDVNRSALPNVDGVRYVPNGEPNGGHNDDDVDEDSAQLRS